MDHCVSPIRVVLVDVGIGRKGKSNFPSGIGCMPSFHPVHHSYSICGLIVPGLGSQWKSLKGVNLPSHPVHLVHSASSVFGVLW